MFLCKDRKSTELQNNNTPSWHLNLSGTIELSTKFMVYSLWFMVYSLWFIVYGLWFMVYVFGIQ